MTQPDLFGLNIPKNTEPKESVEITTTILYLSAQELKEFKKLAKEGIKKMFGSEFQQRGNLTDYILELMRKDNVVSETDELFHKIKEATGRDAQDGSYGFILGTHTPFGKMKGFHSANNKAGYQIWKKTAKGSETKMVTPEEHSFETIVNFLKQ